MRTIIPPEEAEISVRSLARERVPIVVAAPTGWGKSTLIPWWIHLETGGRVIVVEPRRVAAHSLADYVAQTLSLIHI